MIPRKKKSAPGLEAADGPHRTKPADLNEARLAARIETLLTELEAGQLTGLFLPASL